MKKTIIFRVDFSSDIGLGHLMRCLVLAKKFKNANTVFASLRVKDSSLITKHGYSLINLKTNNIDEFIVHVNKIKPKLVVVDSYDITFNDEKKIKKSSTCKLMVFDDNYKKHYCDILLNHNIYADKKRYKNKTIDSCKLLCGNRYTLLRDEFIKEKGKKRKKDGIFIALGGVDSQNLSLKIAKEIPKNRNVKIATTSLNANLNKLKQYSKKQRNIKLYIDTNKIAKLINSSSFAIITPSVIVHEVLYLNTPFLAIKTAKNQTYMYKYLKKLGVTCYENFDQFNMRDIDTIL